MQRGVGSAGYGQVGSLAGQTVPNAPYMSVFSNGGNYLAGTEGNRLFHRQIASTETESVLPMRDSPWSSTELCVISYAHIIDALVGSSVKCVESKKRAQTNSPSFSPLFFLCLLRKLWSQV